MRECRPALTESEHVSRRATSDAREPHLQLLGGFAGRIGPKRRAAPTFAQVGGATGEQPPPKTAQKSRAMAKSVPISCKTARKSQGRDRGQGRGSRKRQRGRNPKHRGAHPQAKPRQPMIMPACPSAQYAHIAKRMLAPDAPQTIARKRSRRTASRPYRLDLPTLRSGHRPPMSMPDAGQRSMRPAHMSRLAASPLADIAKPPDRERLRQSSGNGSKSQPEASRKRYRQRLLSRKQIRRHRLSREEEQCWRTLGPARRFAMFAYSPERIT